MSVESTQTAAPASAAASSAAVSATVGQSIDAEITVIKSRVAQLEASAKTDWSVAIAWAKSNWAHIVLTWPAAATVLSPIVKDLVKLI